MQNCLFLHIEPGTLRFDVDYQIAVLEIYRHWRAGRRIIAILSASTTDAQFGAREPAREKERRS
jgi:hypothetical protein